MANDIPNDQLPKLRGDGAKRSIKDDLFGLGEMAQTIAKAVCSRVPDEGYAIGVEGSWGSGKTTLLNFVQEVLEDEKITVSVIRFEPWLIGKKEGLIADFFKQVSNALTALNEDARVGGRLNQKGLLDRLIVELARYSNYLELGTQVATAVAVLEPTWAAKAGVLLFKILSFVVKLLVTPPPSITTAKANVCADLQEVANLVPNFRIVVVIDDCDRLEPSESVEILRLIKSVANFPLVTYLVGFDKEILAKHIDVALHVDGVGYIEKIFQQVLSLPPQEPFALQRYVQATLAREFPSEFERNLADDPGQNVRREAVFDIWMSKLLKTPRDAVLLCEAVRFGWPYIADKADFLDFVWLQIVKLKCGEFYEWVRRYVANLGAYGDGGRPDDSDVASLAEILKLQLVSLGWGEHSYRSFIGDILPGLADFDAGGKSAAVFKFDHLEELGPWENQKRLGSPSHWRYYFALVKPSYAIDDAEVEVFLRSAAKDWHKAAEILQSYSGHPHAKSGFYVEVLVDKIINRRNSLQDEELLGLVWAFSETLDQYPPDRKSFSDTDVWHKSVKCMTPVISKHFPEIVEKGGSLNWLAYVLRDQGFALGRTGKSPVEQRQWLTSVDFDLSVSAIIKRFRSAGISYVVTLPIPLHVLFCWRQLGDAQEVRDLLAAYSESNAGFLDVVSLMGGWSINSKDGERFKLQTDIIEEFMNARQVYARLQEIAASDHTGSSQKAKDLLRDWSPPDTKIPY